ncbi:MAG: 2-oxoglutarate dehydrogenase complex dihydrolipoyllysine-residue succinyltransferase [Pseudomonadota bacterium]
MAVEIRVPTLGESVTEATVGQWFKKPGDAVAADEPVVELETDKVTVEVPAPAAGTLGSVSVEAGQTVEVGALLGAIEAGDGASTGKSAGSSAGASEAANGAAAPASTNGSGSAGGSGAAAGAAASTTASASAGSEPIEITVPALGESVTEATIGQWLKAEGDAIKADEPLCELETDKVTVEVPAPATGTLQRIAATQGQTVAVGAVIGVVAAGASGGASAAASASAGAPAAAAAASSGGQGMPPSPSAAKMMAEKGLDPDQVSGSGKRGQILKEDVMAASAPSANPPAAGGAPAGNQAPVAYQAAAPAPIPAAQMRVASAPDDASREERVKMSRLRQTIATRLKDAQNTAAMLTTFNDVDMSAVMDMRASYKELFEKRHGIKLGFMGFFVKACIQALKEIPAVNAEIDGGDVIYKNYYHVGVAVGTDKGLVVPVVREADRMSLADIEGKIADFGRRAREGRLTIEEMQGGTFTISNGGVYGSMLSTPILNAPQSGILGMHRIEKRPVAVGDEVKVRPMMYLALSYDHRLVDGKEAVTFLVRVKECLEDPQRFLLEV